MIVKILVVAAAVLSLNSCASERGLDEITEPVVEYVPKPYECGTPPTIDLLNLVDVEWKVIEVGDDTYFALTPEMYEALSTNVSRIVRAARQLRGQRDYYERCIDESKLGGGGDTSL